MSIINYTINYVLSIFYDSNSSFNSMSKYGLQYFSDRITSNKYYFNPLFWMCSSISIGDYTPTNYLYPKVDYT